MPMVMIKVNVSPDAASRNQAKSQTVNQQQQQSTIAASQTVSQTTVMQMFAFPFSISSNIHKNWDGTTAVSERVPNKSQNDSLPKIRGVHFANEL